MLIPFSTLQQLLVHLGHKLPDGGAKLRQQEQMVSARMRKLRGRVPSTPELKAMLQSEDGEEGDVQKVLYLYPLVCCDNI